MKAIVYEKYGSPDVLELKEVEKPTPKEDEILIRVYATAVNFGDIVARKFNKISPPEFNMPFIFWLPARFVFGYSKPSIFSIFRGRLDKFSYGTRVKRGADEICQVLSTIY